MARSQMGAVGVITAVIAGGWGLPQLLDMDTAGGSASAEAEQVACAADVDLSSEQVDNVATIVSVAESEGVGERGQTVAIATAMQESRLRNLDHGDRDSVGMFQQRNAWGPRADRLDPEKSTTMFFTGGQAGQPGLLDIDGWQDMSIAEAAQAVQRSAYPDAYAQHEQTARALAGGCD